MNETTSKPQTDAETSGHLSAHRTVTLRAPDDFSFGEALAYLGRSTNECLHCIRDEKIRKLIRTDEHTTLIEVAAGEDNHTIELRFLDSDTEESDQTSIAEFVSEWFDFGTQLDKFYAMAMHDPILRRVVQDHHGFRVIGIPDLFEALCWAVIGQQINLRFAYALKRRFVEAFGTSLNWNGDTYWAFPTPAEVARLSVGDLRVLQFTEKKSEYILGIAEHISEGLLNKNDLQRMDYDAAMNVLTDIRGIGPWTASYVLMRSLHHPNAFPIADVGLHNAIKQQLNMDRKPTMEEIKNLSSRWSGWEAYATFYLWQSLGTSESRRKWK